MTQIIPVVNTSIHTFQVFIDKTNLIIDALKNNVVTVSNTGSVSVGNGSVIGTFGSNAFFTSTLRGGNTTVSNTLIITSNVIANDSITVINKIVVGNTVVSTNSVVTDTLKTGSISVGNSTSNVVITSTGFANSSLYLTANTRTSVKANNVLVGVRSDLNFIAAGAATIATVDNANTNSVDITISLNANSIVAGANTQIQYNDGGSIAASANLIFDKTTSSLSTNNLVATTFLYQNSSNTKSSFISTVVSTTNTSIVDSFFLADYRGGEYLITIKDNTSNTYQMSKLLLMHNGIVPLLSEYGVLYSASPLGDFSATANASHVILSVSTTTANNTIKATKNLIES